MKTYIDDSGSFNWVVPGKSVFCAVTLPDTLLPLLFRQFLFWKKHSAGLKRQKEIKGCDLDSKLLVSFVNEIVVPHPEFRLTYVAADTKLTSATMVEASRNQFAEVLSVASSSAKKEGYDALAQMYLEMSFWVSGRSAQNFLWMITLYETLFRVMQNTVLSFGDAQFDHEFESWHIIIDKSFIHRERHITFWREWLRNQMIQLVLKRKFKVPRAWAERDHVWLKTRVAGSNVIDTSLLLHQHTYFGDSSKDEGIQLSDICAYICFRYFRLGEKPYEPLSGLFRHIESADGGPITLVHLDKQHFWTDSAEAHVHKFKLEDFIRRYSNQAEHG